MVSTLLAAYSACIKQAITSTNWPSACDWVRRRLHCGDAKLLFPLDQETSVVDLVRENNLHAHTVTNLLAELAPPCETTKLRLPSKWVESTDYMHFFQEHLRRYEEPSIVAGLPTLGSSLLKVAHMRWCARRNSGVRLDLRMPNVAKPKCKQTARMSITSCHDEVTQLETTHAVDAVFRAARKAELIFGLREAIPSLEVVAGWKKSHTQFPLLDIVDDYVQDHEITITIEVTSEKLRKQAHIERGMRRLVVAPTTNICEVIYTFLHMSCKYPRDWTILARDVKTYEEFHLVPEPRREAKDLVMHTVCNNVHLQLCLI